MFSQYFNNERGSTLILVFVTMITLMMAAGWMALQTRTATKVVASEKNFQQTLNLADGALDLAIYTLRNRNRPSPDTLTWNPLKQSGQNSKLNTPYDYMQGEQISLSDAIDDIKFESEVYWLGYSDEAPPGFQIDQASSLKSHTLQYECSGKSELVSQINNIPSHISALLLISSF